MSATNSINNSYRKDVLSDKGISLSFFVSEIQRKRNFVPLYIDNEIYITHHNGTGVE